MILTERGRAMRNKWNLMNWGAILACFVAFGCNTEMSERAAHESSAPSGKFAIACLGDSITFGAGTSDPATKSYPSQLQAALGPSYDVKNFGVSGSTATSVDLDRSYMATNEFGNALRSNARIFVIMLGANDADVERWPKAKGKYSLDLAEIVRSVKLLKNAPKVLLVAPVPAPKNDRERTITDEVVPTALRVATDEGIESLDLSEELSGKTKLFPDTLHPNDEGAKAIADAVAKKITAMLTTRQDFRPSR